jgi:predicted SnoaL-like aldol condensation-catalyzing enzyme
MNAEAAAARWADTWSRAWPKRDAEAIVALYADDVVYRSPAFRAPDLGLAGVRRYLNEQFPAEQNIECWFGRPIASGDRAAVEWWATWMEQGQELTFAGVTLLRFDEQGKVVEHRDYDNHVKRREPPYAEWSSV